MTPTARTLVRGTLVAVGAAAYAVLAHLSNSPGTPAALGIVLSLGPLVLAVLVLTRASRWRAAAWAGCAAAIAVVALRWDYLAHHFAWIYLLQQVAAYAALAITFGRSLAPGRVPLCTQVAALVHRPMAADVAQYTRRVTAAWALLLAAIAVALCVTFLAAPLTVWSAFANFGAFAVLVAMFLGEYAVRRRVLAHRPGTGLIASLRAYHESTRSAAPARRG